jgi:AraC-like DNA-binding protein
MHSQSSGTPLPGHGRSDPLAAVIELLRPETVLSKIVSGAGRWSVRMPAYDDPSFGLVLAGSCFLDADGVGAVELAEGDFILLPATPGFTLASDLRLEPKHITPAPHADETRHGTKQGPPTMRMLGGFFRFDRANKELLVKFLPSAVLVRQGQPGAARLRRVVELIRDESTTSRPGRELILERLVEVLLVEALRFRPTEVDQQEQGLLAGLADQALARALRHIHEDVARAWTVAELARSAGMSRAVFAERFTKKVGMPPMQYLFEWRIALAKDVLRRERVPLAELAEKIGYQSASAFSTAFSRHTGCSPSAFARSSPDSRAAET